MDNVSRRKVLLSSAAVGGAAALGTGQLAAATPAGAVARGVPASTITPADARYPDFVSGSNGRWRARPDAIRVATETEQVVAAVEEAVRAGKRVAVRSGGHCYEAFVYHSATQVVIDLSAMNDISYDQKRRAFVIEPGCTLMEVYMELYRRWGVTIPGGSCSSVGAGGHIQGGGFGLLSRQFGLTSDYIHAVEVVVVNAAGKARAIVATSDKNDPHHDLWWAHTGGGGGNFGIVTRYFLRAPGTERLAPEKQLPQPPGEVYVHQQSWSWNTITEDRFRTLLRNYSNFYAEYSEPGNPYAGMFSMLVCSTRASGSISMTTQIDATRPGAAGRLDDFLAEIGGHMGDAQPTTLSTNEMRAMPELFAPQARPWLVATRQLGGSGWGGRGDYKSAYLRQAFPEEQISAMYKNLTETDQRSALVSIDSYGAQVNAVGTDATAAPQRDSILKLQYQAYWSEDAEEAAKLSWIRNMYRDVYADTGGVPVPNEVNDGCYINYPDIDLSDPEWNTSDTPWHDLYYKQGYPRLQQVKAAYDPGNVFRHAQSVRLPE
ncbi:FAD-binding oxidoreductase [Streptomyces sp. MAR4 CNY-716]